MNENNYNNQKINPEPLFGNNNFVQNNDINQANQNNVYQVQQNINPSYGFIPEQPAIMNSPVAYNQPVTTQAQDVPPMLGEIKNLSDSTIVKAPTLDMLSPDASLSVQAPQQDILNYYDNNANFQNPIAPAMPEAPSYAPIAPVMSEAPSYSPIAPVMSEAPSYSPIAPSVSETPSYSPIVPSVPEAPSYSPIAPAMSEAPTIPSISTTQSEVQTQKTELDESKEIQNGEIEFQTPKEELKEKTEEEIEIVNDLGLDTTNNVSEEIDIMDLSEEKEDEMFEESSDIIEDNHTSLSETKEKINTLIEELKSSGVDIETEEFDFEKLYQIIIKINK